MDPSTKRKTRLPNQLWRKGDDANAKGSELSATHHGLIEEKSKGPTESIEKNRVYRKGVPIKISEKKTSMDKYHKSYNIDQAGTGVIALKDTENLPICLIKSSDAGDQDSIHRLRFASHGNVLSLIDFFRSGDRLHLVYEYEHLAISLGCVAGNVQFSDADIATVCKEILKGLHYVHSALKISYGLLDFSNILLTWQGEVKLANIGDCLLSKHPSKSIQRDIQNLRSIVISLSDRTTALLQSNHGLDTSSLSTLARLFVQRTKQDTNAEKLIKDEFLHLANPGGAWSLKRHYFRTLPLGIRIGGQANEDDD